MDRSIVGAAPTIASSIAAAPSRHRCLNLLLKHRPLHTRTPKPPRARAHTHMPKPPRARTHTHTPSLAQNPSKVPAATVVAAARPPLSTSVGLLMQHTHRSHTRAALSFLDDASQTPPFPQIPIPIPHSRALQPKPGYASRGARGATGPKEVYSATSSALR